MKNLAHKISNLQVSWFYFFIVYVFCFPSNCTVLFFCKFFILYISNQLFTKAFCTGKETAQASPKREASSEAPEEPSAKRRRSSTSEEYNEPQSPLPSNQDNLVGSILPPSSDHLRESPLSIQGLALSTSPQPMAGSLSTLQFSSSTLIAGHMPSMEGPAAKTLGDPEGSYSVLGQKPLATVTPENLGEKETLVESPSPNVFTGNTHSFPLSADPQEMLDPATTVESVVVAGALKAARVLGAAAVRVGTGLGALSTYEYVKSKMPPGTIGKAAAVTAGTSVIWTHPGVRQSFEEGVVSLATAAFRPLDEEANRPRSPREGFSGEASSQAISAQAPNRSLASGTQSDNQILDNGRESMGTGPSEPENPFAPLSIVETPLLDSLDLLFVLAWVGLGGVLFITLFVLITESRLVKVGGFVGRLKSVLQRSLLLRVFKLLLLVWVMCLLLILKSAPYLPLHSDPSIIGIISSAYNLGITLSFYIFGGELVLALENLLSKRTFKGHSALIQFFHALNKYFFYSVYGYYAKLVCCFYLIIAFFVFIYLLN